MTDAEEQAAAATEDTSVAMSEANTAAEALAMAYASAAGAAITYAGTTAQVLGATQSAADALDGLKTAVDDLGAGDEAGLAKLGRVLVSSGAESAAFARTMSGLSGGARDAFGALSSYGAALTSQIKTQADAGASAGTLKKSIRDGRVAFVEQAVAMGMSRDAAKTLATELGLTASAAATMGTAVTEGLTVSQAGWGNFGIKLKAKTGQAMDDTAKALKSDARKAGTEAGGALASGIASTDSEAKAAGKDVGAEAAAGAAAGVAGLGSKGSSAGRDFASGFRAGMAGQASSINSTARGIGAAAVRALREGIDAHSPSRLTKKAGDDYVQGFRDAVKIGTVAVAGDAKRLGTVATDTLADAVGRGDVYAIRQAAYERQQAERAQVEARQAADIAASQAAYDARIAAQLAALATPGPSYTPTYTAGWAPASTTNTIGALVQVQSLTVRSDADVQAISADLWERAQRQARAQGRSGWSGF
jgi:hypothetical protein